MAKECIHLNNMLNAYKIQSLFNIECLDLFIFLVVIIVIFFLFFSYFYFFEFYQCLVIFTSLTLSLRFFSFVFASDSIYFTYNRWNFTYSKIIVFFFIFFFVHKLCLFMLRLHSNSRIMFSIPYTA